MDTLPRAMRNQCRVLIALAEHGPSSAQDLVAHTGLPDTKVRSALTRLCAKGKATGVRRQVGEPQRYEWVEDWTPPAREARTVSARTVPGKAYFQAERDRKKAATGRPSVGIAPRYTQGKLALIRRLLGFQSLRRNLSPEELDLLIGIAADYERAKQIEQQAADARAAAAN